MKGEREWGFTELKEKLEQKGTTRAHIVADYMTSCQALDNPDEIVVPVKDALKLFLAFLRKYSR